MEAHHKVLRYDNPYGMIWACLGMRESRLNGPSDEENDDQPGALGILF